MFSRYLSREQMDLFYREFLFDTLLLSFSPSLFDLSYCVKLLKSVYNARKINFESIEKGSWSMHTLFYFEEMLKKVRPETPFHLAVGVDRSYMIALYIATMVIKFEISV